MSDDVPDFFYVAKKEIMTIPKVKICCITSREEADIAISMGAYALGFVSDMPSGPGIIENKKIKDIVSYVDCRVHTFLLTSKQSASEITEQLKLIQPSSVQIVDRLTSGNYNDIKSKFPTIRIIQVIHVSNPLDISEAIEISQKVDAILLDSGNQSLKIKELGGTGKVHDWSISKKIVEKIKIPVYLAGGLNPNNVLDAIKSVYPFGVDICSGVRTNDKLDPTKLQLFFDKINSLF